MYLKRIEMQGFKSFADKITVEVGKGVTGIVGPNGSGKSNISDALRWVMGEMSAKSLRSGNMQDVIFNGTQKRKPLSFAEVTLILDNETHFFQSEYNEIAVTRRVFRSGESEYLINGSQVRLKDIHELFMDTGLGREGYSVVGQGRIDELLSAKAENRRQVFEEAAGISKYRHRKDEAERKLEKTEDNLVRVRDVLKELEDRVGPLSRQSEKAKKYLNLREELKGIEVSASVDIIDKNREELVKYEELLNNAKYSLERERNSLDEAENESEKLYDLLKQNDEKTVELRAKLDSAKESFLSAENTIKILSNNVENYRGNIQSIEIDIASNEKLSKEGDENVALLEKERAQTEEKLENAQRELLVLEEEAKKVGENMAVKGAELENIRREIRESERALNEADAKSKSLEALKEGIESRRFSVEADITEARENTRRLQLEKDRLDRDIKQAEEVREKSLSQLEKATELLENSEKAIDEKKDEFNKLSSLLGEKQGRLRMLEEMEKALEGYQRSVKDLINDHKNGKYQGKITGILSKLITVPGEYKTAIEIALGGAMQNVVVPSEQDAKEAVNYLKEKKLGRVTFLPLSSQEKKRLEGEEKITSERGVVAVAADLVERESYLDNTIEALLGRVIICDNQDSAIRLAVKNKYKFKIVTLAGELFQVGGSITGGSINRASSVLGRGEEIEQLKKDVVNLDKQIEKKEDEIDLLSDKLDSLYEKQDEARNALNEKDIVLTRLTAERGALESRLNEEKERFERFEKEKSEISFKIENNEALKKEHRELIKKAKETLLQAEVSEKGKNEELNLAMAEKDRYADIIFEKRMHKSNIEKDIDMIKERIENALSRKEAVANENAQKALNKEQINQSIVKILEEIRIIEEEKEKIAEQISSLEAEIIAAAQGKSGTDERVGILRETIKRLNDTIYALQSEVARLETQKSKIDYNIENAVNRLWDEYELSYSAAKECYVPVESISEAQKRIASLKGAIKALGNVNVDSIEEYKEVRERFDFLSSQVKDMEEAKTSLEKLIREITVIMKDIFCEKFVVINKYFGEIFQELFGGGKASVSLLDKDNVLESGIEIEAQPPGKKLLSINLLSGGERALTAIALLFVLMKVSPSPFVVLDEIEAALDDINVYRFAAYMKNRTDTTQFIVITHRRGTMESADVLYGVTMQEKGVSKLLSMSLKDVKEYEEK